MEGVTGAMDDLVEFLRARLAEEQAEAEKQPDEEDYGLNPWAVRWEETGEWNSYPYLRIAKARVLAEVEAKRAVIEEYERSLENSRAHPHDLATSGALLARFGTIKLLAAVYVDHPDYQPEWSPIA